MTTPSAEKPGGRRWSPLATRSSRPNQPSARDHSYSREAPEVVLLDIEMPGLRGDQAVSAIQQHCDGERRPIVILHSGRRLNELKTLARDVGADDAISKSPNIRSFLLDFEKAVGRAKAQSESSQVGEPS